MFGAGGQVGRALASTAPAGQVTALDRLACDIRDEAAVGAAIAAARPQIVVNAAAYTAVDKAEQEPEQAAALNARAPALIAAAARQAGCRFVHISTDFVFGDGLGRPHRTDDPTDPQSVYGRTKRDGEVGVFSADPDALIVRTAWVYAADGGNFVRTMLRLMPGRDRLTIVADQIGTPTHATSLASGIWGLAQAQAHGIHHFTDAGVASWYDFAVAIREESLALGILDRAAEVVPIRTEEYPTPAQRPLYSVLDKSRSWGLLSSPPPHWRVNLRKCLREIAGAD